MTDMTKENDIRKATRRYTALILTLIMCLGLLSACQKQEPEPPAPPAPLVAAFNGFNGSFSPFSAESGNDMAVAEITGARLLTTDRAGAVVYNAADGETVFLDGRAYTYRGIANVSVGHSDTDDKTVYTWRLREDVMFSDGRPLTADDVIFTYYTLLDPSYEGPSQLSSVDIAGLQEYRTQTTARVFNRYLALTEAIYAAGEEYDWTGEEAWTLEMHSYFWNSLRRIWMGDIQAIVDYVYEHYLSYAPYYIGYPSEEMAALDELRVALAMAVWGFGSFEKESAIAKADTDGKPLTDDNGEYILASEGETGVEVKVRVQDENGNYIFTGKFTGETWDLSDTFPTLEDYYSEFHTAYNGDPIEYWNTEGVDDTDVYKTAQSDFILEWGPKDRTLAGKGVANIEGIKKLDDFTVEVTTYGYSGTDIYALGVIVAPLHYYGDESKYDYDNNRFGFNFRDVSKALYKSAKPLGAGPYRFIRYDGDTIYFEFNEHYYRGAPKIAELQFKVMSDDEMVSAVHSGAADIASPAFSAEIADEIIASNADGGLIGESISTVTVDNLGYGYIGMNADTVNVGGVPDGEASRNLRKAFAVLFAVYREDSIDGYFGQRASVIDYPVSNSQYKAPEPGSVEYSPAFSKDLGGNSIYSDDTSPVEMRPDERYAAALAAAVEYLKAAGYTWDEPAGKFTLAPVGAKLEYEIIVPGYGHGDHPSFNICTSVKEALEKIGITLLIDDPSSSDKLWEEIKSGKQEMWCAAWEWESLSGPDIHEIYHSSGIIGTGGADLNYYCIQDSQLDDLIVQMLKSRNDEVRRTTYKECMDIVAEWAVEIPVYKKFNCFLLSTQRINLLTLTPELTAFWDWTNDIELLEKSLITGQKQ